VQQTKVVQLRRIVQPVR